MARCFLQRGQNGANSPSIIRFEPRPNLSRFMDLIGLQPRLDKVMLPYCRTYESTFNAFKQNNNSHVNSYGLFWCRLWTAINSVSQFASLGLDVWRDSSRSGIVSENGTSYATAGDPAKSCPSPSPKQVQGKGRRRKTATTFWKQEGGSETSNHGSGSTLG